MGTTGSPFMYLITSFTSMINSELHSVRYNKAEYVQNDIIGFSQRIYNSKVAFIILSPSAIEASYHGLMRQFELYAIITQPIALMSVAACQASGRLYLFT